jgi:hypothetical protein
VTAGHLAPLFFLLDKGLPVHVVVVFSDPGDPPEPA